MRFSKLMPVILLSLCAAQSGFAEAPKPLMGWESATTVRLQPFSLSDVRLLDGRVKDAMEADKRYLLMLSSNRLLYNYRKNAGLHTPGKPLGGWEAPDWKPYPRGAFLGHYLSACAMMYAGDGDPEIKAKADGIVAELAKCQDDSGYLAAFPESVYDALENDTPGHGHPYYITHKMFAGLVDMYQYAGNKQALKMAVKMGAYFKKRTDKLTQDQIDRMLKEEYGGMGETAYDLYGITHDESLLTLARRFYEPSLLKPLVRDEDNLSGLHANTMIPKIIAEARRYDLLEDQDARSASVNFFDHVADHHTYATGGTSEDEHWGDPDHIAGTLTGSNQETCTTYNMLKLTRDLISWTGDPGYGDYYERNFYNGILSAQNPANGMLIYFLPMADGKAKNWGTPYDSFWCCYGTGVESLAKLGEAIYFHDSAGVYVNLFTPSVLKWHEKGVTLTQETDYPEKPTSAVTIECKNPTRFVLRIRIPAWADSKAFITVNSEPVTGVSPRAWVSVNREWQSGDRVEISLPMGIRKEPLPSDRDAFALMNGPIALAGVHKNDEAKHSDHAASDGVGIIDASPSSGISAWLRVLDGEPMNFTAAGKDGVITFMPLYSIVDEKYGVYWRTRASQKTNE